MAKIELPHDEETKEKLAKAPKVLEIPERKKDFKKTFEVKEKKKTLKDEFKDVFQKEDFDSIKDYVLEEKVKPGISNLAMDIVDYIGDSIHEVFFRSIIGNDDRLRRNRRRRDRRYYDDDDYVHDYGSYYSSERERKRERITRKDKSGVKQFIFQSKADAQDLLDMLCERAEDYESGVSIAHYYQLIGKPVKSVDYNYGWRNLAEAKVVEDDGDYYISFPRTQLLD